MRCIIPAAGQGTRLRPQTHTKPKALLSLGNKPIISHILDNVVNANIKDIVIVVGYEKDQLINYVKANYGDSCNFSFIEQKNRKGLGHAIYSASEYLDGDPVLITLGDSLYENSFSHMLKEFNDFPDWNGAIAVKSVSNPQAYGIVYTDKETNSIEKLEEKPKNPSSSLAITGVYVIRNSLDLKKALNELITSEQIGAGGEFQLTDALQIMIDKGLNLGTIDSGRWFDCGQKKALLAAHKFVLDKSDTSFIESGLENTITISPVSVQENCRISNSIIGPYVSIDKNTVIDKSILSSSIVGRSSHISNSILHDSLIGDEVKLIGRGHDLNIGDHSKVQFF
ncbi:MAG: NTP transferase domain-containing protein [Candidatus Heimdallarchaeota archaeon]|nr:MAG: NTP transferase domain-containing protein [Candidatus Heimdallarchaeota archaeon]